MITIDPESAVDCFWNELPSTYVVCERDQTIHPDMQRAMSTNAGRVHSLSTDHSPFMSAHQDVLPILVRASKEN